NDAASPCRGASHPMHDRPRSDESRLVPEPSTPRRSCDLGHWRNSGAQVSRQSSCRSLFCSVALTNFVSGLIPFVHISSSSFSLAHPGAQYRGSTLDRGSTVGLPSLSNSVSNSLIGPPWSSHSRPSRVCWEDTL